MTQHGPKAASKYDFVKVCICLYVDIASAVSCAHITIGIEGHLARQGVQQQLAHTSSALSCMALTGWLRAAVTMLLCKPMMSRK